MEDIQNSHGCIFISSLSITVNLSLFSINYSSMLNTIAEHWGKVDINMFKLSLF